MKKNYGLSSSYWDSLSDEHKEMYHLVRPLRTANYQVNNSLSGIEKSLEMMREQAESVGGTLELNPDFQRGHVWNEDQQIRFIESLIRGSAPVNIKFNCVNWGNNNSSEEEAGMNPNSIFCIDGLQRLTAMRRFAAGEIKVFDKYYINDLDDTPFTTKGFSYNWVMEMYDFPTRRDLLQFYIDLNSGGVVHSDDEINRVKTLLAETKAPENTKPEGKKSSRKKAP